ncbi:TatD DNase family Scn1 [Amanita rubescens]|nr:TatD DNase family Scn1 [Amanita rubescens]
MTTLPNEQILRHVVDVHCHPTDAPQIPHETMQRLSITLCAMATRQSDQQRVRDLALQYPDKVIPCFGYHPWFCHAIATQPFASKYNHYQTLLLGTSESPDLLEAFEKLLPHLPEPRLLSDIVQELRDNLRSFPDAMLGEVGLDRSFRLPIDYFSSPRELTPFTIPLEHQLIVLEAQLDLAVELERNISFHSVKSQQATIALLDRMRSRHSKCWHKISIDFHSCGFSPETWRRIEASNEHPNTFLSLSVVINGRNSNLKRLIAACAPDRILVESDYDNAEMTTPMTWEMLLIVAEIKGWKVEEEWGQDLNPVGAVRRLEENWKRFKEGNHCPFPMKGHNIPTV